MDHAYPQAIDPSVAPFAALSSHTPRQRSSGSAVPAPRRGLADLAPETFQQVIGDLAPKDVLNLRQAGPAMLFGIPKSHQQWAMLSLRADAARTAHNFNEVLNGVASLVDEQRESTSAVPLGFSDLTPAGQHSVLRRLMGRVQALPLNEQYPGIVHIVKAIGRQAVDERPPLLQTLMDCIMTRAPRGDLAARFASSLATPRLLLPVVRAIDWLPPQLQLPLQVRLAAGCMRHNVGIHHTTHLLVSVLSRDGFGAQGLIALQGGLHQWQTGVHSFLRVTQRRPTPQRLVALHVGLGMMADHGVLLLDPHVMARRSWALGQTLDSIRNWTIPNEHRPAIADSMQRVVNSLPPQDRAALQARVDLFRAGV
jgi:hypothetical protein